MNTFKFIEPTAEHFHEIVVRLIALPLHGPPVSYGTAFVVAPRIAVTAKHVADEFLRADPGAFATRETDVQLRAIQIVNGPSGHRYIMWDIAEVSFTGASDLALLVLVPHEGDMNASSYTLWKVVPCTLFPPAIGSNVTAFGHYATSFAGTRINMAGLYEHIELTDKSASSTGTVTAVHVPMCDAVMAPFPCFETDAQAEGGMSGGFVIDDRSRICGVVATGMPATEESPVHTSWAALLFPLMAIKLDFDLIPGSPITGEHYVLDYARSGAFHIEGLEKVVLEENPSGTGFRVYMKGVTLPDD